MPLIKSKSKQAVSKNIETEMDAGKPQKQSIAIALNVQRHAKKKKMAYGGEAQREDGYTGTPPRKPDDMRPPESEYMADHFAYGGEAVRDDGYPGQPAKKPDNMRPEGYMSDKMTGQYADGGEVEDHYDGIASAIMRKKRKMADGGMVDINENAQESGQTPYDNDNSEAYKKELYDDDQLSDQPTDSNEHGDSDDDYSVSSQVRKRMRSRG